MALKSSLSGRIIGVWRAKRLNRNAYDRKKIGNRLRARRLALGFTQEQVAEMIDKSLTFYTRVELGTAGMSVDTLLAVCTALKTRPDDVLLDPRAEEDVQNQQWIAEAISNCPPEKQRVAINLLKAYLGEK